MNALFGTPLSIMPLYAIRSEKATGSPSTTSSAPVVTAVAPQRSSVFTASAVLTAQAAAPPITWSVKPVAVTMRSAFSSSPEERSTCSQSHCAQFADDKSRGACTIQIERGSERRTPRSR